MTPSLHQELIDIGVLPPMMMQEMETVADTQHTYPYLSTKNYFYDPRDENGEVPY